MKQFLLLLVFALVHNASVAFACGGFFCNAQPVDQQAERIIFVQEDENTISSYVEIQYQGAPEAFAWIVPVPSVPELDVWNGQAFNSLDLATQPQWNFLNNCFLDEAAESAGPPQNDADDGVMVLDMQRVGPFDTVTLQSNDPRELVEWLRRNEYRIVPAMEPFIALYTAENMKFLAMKLAPGEDTASIQPIKMTYSAANPAVPLRLTAVAAQLEMGVKIWILGDRRFGPKNVPDITVSDDEVVMDFRRWENNYLPLVARKVDAAGGHGFITELAGPTGPLAEMIRESFVPDRAGQEGLDARAALAELVASKPYITRLYTRVSPEEMDIDPIFHAIDGPDVSNIHNIESEDDVDACGPPAFDAAQECDFMACGAGGVCAALEESANGRQVGCACADGTVARVGQDPQGRPMVSCGDARIDFSSTPSDSGQIQFPDLCAGGNFCGDNGECLTVNGFPACRCATGYLAVPALDAQGMLTPSCVPAMASADIDLTAIRLPEPNLPYPGRAEPLDPMPMDRDTDPMDVVDPGARPTGMVSPNSNDNGCQSMGGANSGLLLFVVMMGALGRVRRLRR
ncbi:MAG: DUF2330 domain-containing protein [Bradymonadia bacterium]